MAKNYVSVCGISNIGELSAISEISKQENFPFTITIGYQISGRSINEGTQNPRQPKFADLADLDRATRDYGFLTAIHYYGKDGEKTVSDIEKIVDIGVDCSKALIQFNTLPQNNENLRMIKEMGFQTIFKVAVSNKSSGGYKVWKGEEVQDVNKGNSETLLKQVFDRKELIDYAMFDASHGTNLELDLDENSLAVKFGKGITTNRELDHLGLVYAGGIKPSNVRQITRSLNSFFPNRASIDIESGVRTNNILDMNLVRDYLLNCGFDGVSKK